MKCINVKENLDALLDGEVSFTQKREIENHLETCVSCQTEFENLQAISGILKQNLAISAPLFLDKKVFSEFKNFHAEKPKEKLQKIGWFGIPRFAFAAALILFTLGIISAFQIGKMSASEISVIMPEVQENKTLNQEKIMSVKIVEVPVIREKIVKVPVIKEKIVTKIIYVNKDEKTDTNLPAKKDFALKNKIEDNKYLTRSNLEGFQPVSEMNLRISKEDNQNEK